MPGLGLVFWLSYRSMQAAYFALLASALHTWLFAAYGFYLDLCLTRIYIESLTDKKERLICAWSEKEQHCVPPEGDFDSIVVLGSSLQPQKIWGLPHWHWSFSGPQQHQCHFRPHDRGWFPASLQVRAPSGAYHTACLSWGGRLSWESGITKADDLQQPPEPTDSVFLPIRGGY